MGWLGWTYDQTQETPMPAIEAAHRGRVKMLRAIFGGGDEPEQSEQPKQRARPMSPALFDALFAGAKGG